MSRDQTISGSSSLNSLQSPFENSFGKSAAYHSNPTHSHNIWNPPFRSMPHNIIGAFPRSDSMLSSSYSIAALCQGPQPHDPLEDSLTSMAERSDRLLNDLVSAERPATPRTIQSQSSPSSNSLRQKNLPQKNLSATPSDPAFESPQPGVSERLLTPYSAERGHHRPDSFINSDISRASSIEGLAALRNGNSPKVGVNLKKSNSRSSHLRQFSNILTGRSRESSTDGEASSPRRSSSKTSTRKVHTQNRPSSIAVRSEAMQTHAMVMPQTWRSSSSPDEYEALLNEYGPVEIRRQEVIWELCETELTFVDGMRRVIDIFASPLRTPHGTWIDGVPTIVAKLLDWLEDIVNLHAEIAAMAERYRVRQTHADGLVLRIADAFLKFVPRLEVHQAYLVRFSSVMTSIEDMTCDLESDFGEFVRMQTSLPECGHMNLPSFLLKPVQRLMKYPLFYKQLCDMTPPNHPDHIATSKLLHATDSIIRVLQEVKGREDEYENLKILQTRIKGLPVGFQLAQRDRRLLAQGLLRRVQVSSRELAELESDRSNHNRRQIRTRISIIGTSPSHYPTTMHSARPLSQISDHSEFSLHSIQSKSSTSSAFELSPARGWAGNSAPSSDELPPPLTPSSSEFSPGFPLKKLSSPMPSESLFTLTNRRDQTYNLNSEHSPDPRTRQRTITASRLMKRTKESPIHVFVFSDLIVLATRHNDGVRLIRSTKIPLKKKEQMTHYCALETIGLSRPLLVDDVSGELGYDHLIRISALPITTKGTNSNVNEQEAGTTVFLTFPDRLPGSRYPASREVIQREKYKWLAALDQSLRSPLKMSDSEGRSDRTTRKTRTPSDPGLWNAPMDEQEREERTWWMERHQTVKRDMELEAARDDDHVDGSEQDMRRHSINQINGNHVKSLTTKGSRKSLSFQSRQRDSMRVVNSSLENPGLGLTLNFL